MNIYDINVCTLGFEDGTFLKRYEVVSIFIYFLPSIYQTVPMDRISNSVRIIFTDNKILQNQSSARPFKSPIRRQEYIYFFFSNNLLILSKKFKKKSIFET